MSEIPYNFIPIPNYFRDHGWFKNHNCLIFVLWAFSRCSTKTRKIFHDHKEIILDPFEFISGLNTCADETGLTVQQIRTTVKNLVFSEILKKSTSKTTSKFSVYKWNTDVFSETVNKQNNTQLTRNQHAPNNNQEPRTKIIDIKEPTPTPSVSVFGFGSVPLEKEGIGKEKIYSCLKTVIIADKDKERLTKQYDEVDIQRGVEVLAKTRNPRDSVAVIVGIAKKKELNNIPLNRQWVQEEIFDDNPEIAKDMRFSGDYVTNDSMGKELHLSMEHERFKETFLAIFILSCSGVEL